MEEEGVRGGFRHGGHQHPENPVGWGGGGVFFGGVVLKKRIAYAGRETGQENLAVALCNSLGTSVVKHHPWTVFWEHGGGKKGKEECYRRGPGAGVGLVSEGRRIVTFLSRSSLAVVARVLNLSGEEGVTQREF